MEVKVEEEGEGEGNYKVYGHRTRSMVDPFIEWEQSAGAFGEQKGRFSLSVVGREKGAQIEIHCAEEIWHRKEVKKGTHPVCGNA